MIPNNYDYVMYREGSQRRVVHVPDGDIPLCVSEGEPTVTHRKRRWVQKDSSTIPDGHYPDCQYCTGIIAGK